MQAAESRTAEAQLRGSFPQAGMSSPPTTSYSDADSLSDPDASEMDRQSSMGASPEPEGAQESGEEGTLATEDFKGDTHFSAVACCWFHRLGSPRVLQIEPEGGVVDS